MAMIRTVYSAKLRAALDELRPAVCELGRGVDQLTRRRAEIAPLFVRAYQIWRRETQRPFIAFVHELDPTMPLNNRSAYRQHGSYRAAQYLLQLVEKPKRTPKARGLTPLALLAVTIKSLLPLCGSVTEQRLVLEGLVKASRWRDAEVKKLMATIRRANQVLLPNVPRLVKSTKSTREVVVAYERESRAS